MNALEAACVVVVVVWLGLRLRAEPDRRALLSQLLVIAVAAFVGEDSCIRAYGFYFYAPDRWTLFIDRVPLLILLIWPVVVTSALDLARALKAPPRFLWALLLLLVTVDASFIEPIATDAGLWSWTEPGPFAVPVIGVIGWGCFAAGIGVVVGRGWPLWSCVVVAPLVCHALLLLLWWTGMRFLGESSELGWAVGAVVVAFLVVVKIVKSKPPALRPLVWLRAPAALFFFSLLALHTDVAVDADDSWLLVWSLAAAPPWLAVMIFSRPAASSTEQSSSSSSSSAS